MQTPHEVNLIAFNNDTQTIITYAYTVQTAGTTQTPKTWDISQCLSLLHLFDRLLYPAAECCVPNSFHVSGETSAEN